MFTGIVEELGWVAGIEHIEDSARLSIRGPRVTADAQHGVSIAVNGVCLTVVEQSDFEFTADVMKETLDHTSLGALQVGDRVNLERAMLAGGRYGGHVVQGHVDGVGQILERIPGARWELLRISLPTALARYVVEKGSITVDGISLTVARLTTDSFTVSLIPTTLELTTLGAAAVGDPVNLEVDVLAKYMERLAAPYLPRGRTPQPGDPEDLEAPPAAPAAPVASDSSTTAEDVA
jgi:riboflavin synthase